MEQKQESDQRAKLAALIDRLDGLDKACEPAPWNGVPYKDPNFRLACEARNALPLLLTLARLTLEARDLAFESVLDPDDEDCAEINERWILWDAMFWTAVRELK